MRNKNKLRARAGKLKMILIEIGTVFVSDDPERDLKLRELKKKYDESYESWAELKYKDLVYGNRVITFDKKYKGVVQKRTHVIKVDSSGNVTETLVKIDGILVNSVGKPYTRF